MTVNWKLLQLGALSTMLKILRELLNRSIGSNRHLISFDSKGHGFVRRSCSSCCRFTVLLIAMLRVACSFVLPVIREPQPPVLFVASLPICIIGAVRRVSKIFSIVLKNRTGSAGWIVNQCQVQSDLVSEIANTRNGQNAKPVKTRRSDRTGICPVF
ncbi:hypothetical protein PIB30_029200 [Stylosanthes scabra]|uniref:Uncharacterized protein n=1 Tax=Stylosanthes scabra TaxID=79078 RepID=A0ABU6QBE3_9FABA|nr:hypothetical protein [Stylosanthes scabra]